MTAPLAAPATPAPALELAGVSRTFGVVRALDDVHFAVAQGSVHALLGENGAGKTTLMRVAYGLVAPDAGTIRLFGRDARRHSVRGAMKAGVGMVQQHLSLVPAFTAAENIALGRHGYFDPARAAARLRSLQEESGLHVAPERRARDLGVVEQQRLEILKTLARGARLLILDEPTTGLAPSEVDDLLRWIRRFADAGGSVVLVTHRLREALAVADAVTVLRWGRVTHVGPGAAGGASAPSLARAIFPDASETAPAPPASTGAPVARLRDVVVQDARGIVRARVSMLDVRRGEILGVAGVEGSGHRALLSALAGLVSPGAGRLELPPRVALIPSDRLREGLVPGFTLVENVALRGAGDRRGRTPWRALAAQTRDIVARFGIAAPSPQTRAQELSGGNQQRLVVGRELAGEVDLVVADDPTRGLDGQATRFVHDELRAVAARGAAVVVHASDLDDLLGLATRVIVVFHGAVSEPPMDRDAIGRAMLGA